MKAAYEKLKSLPLAKDSLQEGITFEQLDVQAKAMSDDDVAQRLNDARAILFKTIFSRSKKAA